MEDSFITLQQLALRTINNHYKQLSSQLICIPKIIGREIVRIQLLRGLISSDLLDLAWTSKVKEISLLNLNCGCVQEAEIDQLNKLSETLEIIRIDALEVPTAQLSKLFLGFNNLRVFEFSHSDGFVDEVAEMVIRNNRNLNTFLVGNTKITDLTLNLLAACDKLKTVDVSYNKEISNKGLRRLCNGRSRKILEDLSIYMCEINDETITYILNTCPSLRNVFTFASMKTFEADFEERRLHNIEYFVPF